MPVALGLAISAACALAGFERDIRTARFGWRQPLGLLMSVTLVVAGLKRSWVSRRAVVGPHGWRCVRISPSCRPPTPDQVLPG
ncbi:MAG: hypothetical protein R2715_24165 [Ilumatobacteraceae bacterium]